jgi:hypothetical protein
VARADQQPRRHPTIVLPDRQNLGGIVVLVAAKEVMGDVSGMEISAVIGYGDRGSVKVLEQL